MDFTAKQTKNLRESLTKLANSLTKTQTYNKLKSLNTNYFSKYKNNNIPLDKPLNEVYELVKSKKSRNPKEQAVVKANLQLLDNLLVSVSLDEFNQNLNTLAQSNSIQLDPDLFTSTVFDGFADDRKKKSEATAKALETKLSSESTGGTGEAPEEKEEKPPEEQMSEKPTPTEPTPEPTQSTPTTAEAKPKLRGKRKTPTKTMEMEIDQKPLPTIKVKGVKRVKKPSLRSSKKKEEDPIESARLKTAQAEAKFLRTINEESEEKPVTSMEDIDASDIPAEQPQEEEQEQPILEPEPEPAPAPAPAPTPPSTPIKMRVNKTTEIKKDTLPTKVDLIPPERLSSEDKTVAQLKADIDYFYKNFKEKLRKIPKISSNNLKVLQRFHKRIVAVLRGDKPDTEKQIGVIIKGDTFIKDKLKEIILENSINGLSASDLLVNIEGEPDKDKPSAGDYEFKINPTTGKEFAEGQPVSRLIPTTEPDQVSKESATYKKPISRIPMPKSQYRGPEVTARRQVAANPFLNARQPKIRLKYSY